MCRTRSYVIWGVVVAAVVAPTVAAAMSPLLAWRDPIYIAAGFAGIIAMVLLLMQPLLAGGYLPGTTVRSGRQIHRWVGGALVGAITIHVAGLWITSPPDVIDALLFSSPTPFSAWGVLAMWSIFGAALLALLRPRLSLRPLTWRRGHTALVTAGVVGSIVHAVLIEGTMESVSKFALCLMVLLVTAKTVIDLRAWAKRNRGGNQE